jgi:hypothetical protein
VNAGHEVVVDQKLSLHIRDARGVRVVHLDRDPTAPALTSPQRSGRLN